MSEWKEQTLKHLTDIRVSNVDKKIHNGKALVKLCNYMDVYSNDYIKNDIPFQIGSADINELSRFSLKCDDVIITKDSESPDDIAVPAVIREPIDQLVCGYHLAILRPDQSQIYGIFLMHKLKLPEVKKHFFQVANGSTRYGLTIGDIEKVKINIPTSLSEQRKIARILSTVDAVIEKTEAAIAKYKAIKSGMMHDLFTRGIALKTGKLRPRYEDAPELYKESELGWVPKEWEVVRINRVSILVTNGFVGVATPYYESSDNGVKYLYGTNIRKNEITFEDIRYVNRLFHNKQVKSQLKTGDMLTVQSGHIGTSAIVPDNLGDANCHALIITRFVLSEIFPWFIAYYLNSDMGMHGLEKLFIGSTIKHINTSELAKHLILKPGIEEQKEISKKIDSIELLVRNEFEIFSKMQNLKFALMSDLLTGNVRVQYNENEKVEAM